jgi:hypothetical protein
VDLTYWNQFSSLDRMAVDPQRLENALEIVPLIIDHEHEKRQFVTHQRPPLSDTIPSSKLRFSVRFVEKDHDQLFDAALKTFPSSIHNEKLVDRGEDWRPTIVATMNGKQTKSDSFSQKWLIILCRETEIHADVSHRPRQAVEPGRVDDCAALDKLIRTELAHTAIHNRAHPTDIGRHGQRASPNDNGVLLTINSRSILCGRRIAERSLTSVAPPSHPRRMHDRLAFAKAKNRILIEIDCNALHICHSEVQELSLEVLFKSKIQSR